MTNLLSANLFRLRKSRLFWVCLLLSAAAGAWEPIGAYINYRRDYPLDAFFFAYAMLIGLLLSIFLSLFFGSEYSDGTIRNKLAAGHTRLSVYLANLMTAVLTALLFCGGYILFTLVTGVPLLGPPQAPAVLLTSVLLSLLMAGAWAAVYTAVILNCSRKSVSAVSCILLYLVIFMAAVTVYRVLTAPEFWPGYELAEGEMAHEMIRNPNYLQGGERKFYEFLLDLNPMGQAIQYTDGAVVRPIQMALCSVGVFATTAAAGIALFRRKDLK